MSVTHWKDDIYYRDHPKHSNLVIFFVGKKEVIVTRGMLFLPRFRPIIERLLKRQKA